MSSQHVVVWGVVFVLVCAGFLNPLGAQCNPGGEWEGREPTLLAVRSSMS